MSNNKNIADKQMASKHVATKQIAWEKWHNPFGDDDGQLEKFKDICQQEENGNLMQSYDEDDEDDEESTHIVETDQIKVMSTPMGIVPITEHTDPNKIFNFWVGHANFNLSPNVVNVINDVVGVETLDVFTRYRMRIGIGKHPSFQDRDILHKIDIAVSGSINTQ